MMVFHTPRRSASAQNSETGSTAARIVRHDAFRNRPSSTVDSNPKFSSQAQLRRSKKLLMAWGDRQVDVLYITWKLTGIGFRCIACCARVCYKYTSLSRCDPIALHRPLSPLSEPCRHGSDSGVHTYILSPVPSVKISKGLRIA